MQTLPIFWGVANITRMTSVGTGIAPATPIPATVWGSQVQIQEDVAEGSSWPKTDLLVFCIGPTGLQSAVSRRIPAGSAYTFQKGLNGSFAPGDTIGFVACVTGTADLIVDESGS